MSYVNLSKVLENSPKEHEGFLVNALPSIFDPRNYKYKNLFPASVTAETTPETIDYRPFLPPVFNQGRRGSCVPSASLWTMKAYQEKKQEDYPTGGFSVAYLYSLCKMFDGIPNTEGTYMKTVMEMLQKYGACPESIMPYSTLSSLSAPRVPVIPANAHDLAVKYRINTYTQLCDVSDVSRSEVLNVFRATLKNDGPFVIAMTVYSNFVPDYGGVIPLPKGDVNGGHAVGIVGDLPDRKCLILRNSWGTTWGQRGYAYLPYEWITSNVSGWWDLYEGWTAVDLVVKKPANIIEVYPDVNNIVVDGVIDPMDVPATMINDRLLIPIRKLAENMGYVVDWDGTKAILRKIC